MRLLACQTTDLNAHAHSLGALPRHQAGALIEMVKQAGLTGRGGAAFPTWRKLQAVASGRDQVVVANGAEGEPASRKDRVLLTTAPHLVLDGLQMAAAAVGARSAYLYVPAGIAAFLGRIVGERRATGWDRAAVTVRASADSFISGQESAVVAAIEGRKAVPYDARHRVVEWGIGGAPTLVQNVETLAHLALIARHGPAWFREVGTRDEPGTMLVTLSGAVTAPGVSEAPIGTPIEAVLDAGGGPSGPLQAVLVGGYHGAWIPADSGLRLSKADLAEHGASPGAGVLIALPRTACGLHETARIVDYLAGESARQCGPCLNGLPHLASLVGRLAAGERRPELPTQVGQLCRLLVRRGACQHPDGTTRLVRSMLRTFSAELDRHLHGHCAAALEAVR